MKINEDIADFLFRALFCTIFIGLGGEHLVSGELILRLMPDWVPYPNVVSMLCGLWLIFWGGLIFIGWQVHLSAVALGVFLIVVSFAVHLPGVMSHPVGLSPEYYWLWDILQRSNLVKNACLLGVCFWLLHHDVGKYSVEWYLEQRKKNSPIT